MLTKSFAGDLRRVTGSWGGEALLIIGTKKTALYDTGMAFCSKQLVYNIKRALKDLPLDYVLLSHTHYDHVGGIPALRREWPSLTVCGSKYGQEVLRRTGALNVIRHLSETANRENAKNIGASAIPLEYKDAEMRIDQTLKDGDVLSLGNRSVRAIETKGHTNCSLTFYLEGEGIVLASESTGAYLGNGKMMPSVLTSYRDAAASIEACRNLNAKHIFSPHYLQVEDDFVENYWDLAETALEEMKAFILGCIAQGLCLEEILVRGKERYWIESVKREQPLEAFYTNMKAKIELVGREFGSTGRKG